VVKGHVLALMGMLHRLAGQDPAEVRPLRREAAERVAPALDYLTRHYGEPVLVPRLAEMCFASESSFRRLFRQATGRNPQEYLTYLRVQMATALLESTSATILEVSQRVGYATPSSFNRHFRRMIGCSPRQWRRRSPAPGDA
jgi:AraC-like DNA-binding protein